MRVGWTKELGAVGAGQQRGVDDGPGREQLASGQQRVGVEPRTGAVNTGLRRLVADKMGPSEEDESR